MTDGEKLYREMCDEIIKSDFDEATIMHKAVDLMYLVYNKCRRSIFDHTLKGVHQIKDSKWEPEIVIKNPLVLKTRDILYYDKGIILSPAEILEWVKDDDYEVVEVLDFCEIDDNTEQNESMMYDIIRRLKDRIPVRFFSNARKRVKDLDDSIIDWFWDWYDKYIERISEYHPENIRSKYGMRPVTFEGFDENSIAELFTAKTTKDAIKHPIMQSILKHEVYIKNRIPLVQIPFVEMDTGYCPKADRKKWWNTEKVQSLWDAFVEDSKEGNIDIDKCANKVKSRYEERVSYTKSYTHEYEPSYSGEIRRLLDRDGIYKRLKDFMEHGTANKDGKVGPIPIVLPEVENVFPDLLRVRRRLLCKYDIDLGIDEVIYLICGLYFELDWVTSRDEWRRVYANALRPKIFEYDYDNRLDPARDILQFYYENCGLARNEFAESDVTYTPRYFSDDDTILTVRCANYIMAIEDPELNRLVNANYENFDIPSEKGDRKEIEFMAKSIFYEGIGDDEDEDEAKSRYKKKDIRFVKVHDEIHHESSDPCPNVSSSKIIDGIKEYYSDSNDDSYESGEEFNRKLISLIYGK